jgi:hypothetical protein
MTIGNAMVNITSAETLRHGQRHLGNAIASKTRQ